jgi:hypothetical protein
VLQRLDDGHVDAEGLPGAGDHPLAVDVQAGKAARVRAGGQDDVRAV